VSQRRAKGPAVVGAMQAPAEAEHFPHTKQLELGAVTVILHSYPSKLPRVEDADELVRRQVAALREFADGFEAQLTIPLGSNITKGGST